jgi:hypothetical protein
MYDIESVTLRCSPSFLGEPRRATAPLPEQGEQAATAEAVSFEAREDAGTSG